MLQGTDHVWCLAHPAVKAGIVFVADFAVPHHVALPQQILHQRFTDSIVMREIIAIGKVKEVNIPAARRVMLLEVLQGYLIGRRATCPTAVREGEKVLLWYHLRLRVMGDKHRLDVLVLQAQEPHHPEEKAFRYIFFTGGHRATAVHEHIDRGVGMLLLVLIPDLEAQVVVMQVAYFSDPSRRVALD